MTLSYQNGKNISTIENAVIINTIDKIKNKITAISFHIAKYYLFY